MFRCLGSHRQIEFLYEIGQIGDSAAFLKTLLGSASPGPCPVLCGVCVCMVLCKCDSVCVVVWGR